MNAEEQHTLELARAASYATNYLYSLIRDIQNMSGLDPVVYAFIDMRLVRIIPVIEAVRSHTLQQQL